jgi:hypothetical protein
MAHELRKDEEERRARAAAGDPQSAFSRQMQSTFAGALLPQRSNRVVVDATEVDGRYNDVNSESGLASEPETAEGVLGKAISDALAGGMPNSGGPTRAVAKAAAPKKAKAAAMSGATADEDDASPKPNRRPKRRKQAETPVKKAVADWDEPGADMGKVAKSLRKIAEDQPRMAWLARLAERRAKVPA